LIRTCKRKEPNRWPGKKRRASEKREKSKSKGGGQEVLLRRLERRADDPREEKGWVVWDAPEAAGRREDWEEYESVDCNGCRLGTRLKTSGVGQADQFKGGGPDHNTGMLGLKEK